MAYNIVPTVATGDLWTAAQHNTYIRDNFAAGVPDIFTAAGDLVYGSAVNAAARLGIGSEGQVLKAVSGLPAWASLLAGRVGGDSNDWVVPGTTVYTPTNLKIFAGVISETVSNSGGGSFTNVVTFPSAYSKKPLVFGAYLDGPWWFIVYADKDTITTTQFRPYWATWVGNISGTLTALWISMGE